jgi:hypothetical protein
MFTIYLYKSTLTSRKKVNARAAALNAVNYCLYELGRGRMIERDIGIEDWVVVL